jgi:hypothetical protein
MYHTPGTFELDPITMQKFFGHPKMVKLCPLQLSKSFSHSSSVKRYNSGVNLGTQFDERKR